MNSIGEIVFNKNKDFFYQYKKMKVVEVYNKNNKYLSNCKKRIALSLIKRKRAIKIGKNKIIIIKENYNNKEIVKRDNRICYICGKKIPKHEIPTVDHVISRKNFGTDDLDNLKCCCKRCNNDKKKMNIDEYVKYIKRNKDKYNYISNERLKYLEKVSILYAKK